MPFLINEVIRFGSAEMTNLRNRSISVMLARPGDLNIGLIAEMTEYDATTQQCGAVPFYFGCQEVEMAIYAVNWINGRSDLLPNITLGFVGIDGCWNDMKSLEMVMYFISDDNSCWLSEDPVEVHNRLSDELKHYRVVGVIGPATSRSATAVSPFLGVSEIPVIGIYATSDELSDKSRYKYFMRLVASNRYQVLALLGVARYYGWTYVSVVYTEGSYGENGIKQIDDLLDGEASSYGICIAVALKIGSLADKDDYFSIANKLISNENARVIITFIETADTMQTLLNVVSSKTEIGTFIWLGADGLDLFDEQPVAGSDMLEGAMYVEHPFYTMPDFEDFLKTITPANSLDNRWILSSWEHEYRCKFSNTVNPTYDERCSLNLTLDSTICPVAPGIYNRVHDAFLVFALALHDYISDTCPLGFVDKEVLKNCIRGDVLLERIKRSSFEGILGIIEFNDDGDFLENLQVRQYYLSENHIRRSKIVGLWNATSDQLSMNESQIDWKLFNKIYSLEDINQPPLSVCSRPCPDNQYVLQQALPCCWICGTCRDNEIVLQNRTGCQSCPILTWPDEETNTVCMSIDPVYLHYSDVLSIALLCFAVIIGLCAIICAHVFLAKRKIKLVKAHSLELSLFILVGTLVVCVTAVIFVVPPNTAGCLCIVRYVGFHFGISMIYTPLLVKNIRIYRIFASGKKGVRKPQYVSTQYQMVFVMVILTIQVGYCLLLLVLQDFCEHNLYVTLIHRTSVHLYSPSIHPSIHPSIDPWAQRP